MQSSKGGGCAVFHRGLKRLPHLDIFLGQTVHHGLPEDASRLTATAGWGLRRFSRRARQVARERGIPFLCLEDGFLRSVGLAATDPPLSLVVDELGIYYDAMAPSRLEALVGRALSPSEVERARALMAAWREGRVSKYNHAREYGGPLPKPFVLAVDQTWGDVSIRQGGADSSSFQRMLDAALAENPACTVVLKIHPDVVSGRKKGHFDIARLAQNPRILVLANDVHPAGLLAQAERVCVVTSQLGFEALLWGKPVDTFGMPFYAGWGLTRDALPAPKRRRDAPLENVVHGALVDYPRYLDPETGTRCEVERVLEWLALQRRMRERFPAQVCAVGFTPWKRPIVRAFFQGSHVTFRSRADFAPSGLLNAVWGRKPVPGRFPQGADLVHIEDGFLRSVGLGANLVRPISWVMDRAGIYYDATRPSDLENLLSTAEFPAALIERAARLRERILAAGLTKYSVGTGVWRRPDGAQRLILVPGQVESDASIRFGAPGIKTCMELLRTVREAKPEACVIYKPHPDVVARLRPRGRDENRSPQWCDAVVTDTSMGDLLPLVDEVHCLSSLTGFEALLRGKKVTCYGQPFFAGWGLTADILPVARRSRRLMLDELVAGALILYSTYVSRVTGKFTTPERIIDELLAWKREAACPSASRKVLSWFRRVRAKVLRTPSTVFGTPRT